MNRSWTGVVALTAAMTMIVPGIALAQPPQRGAPPTAVPTPGPGENNGRFATESQRLADGLTSVLVEAGWDDIVDHNVRVDDVAQPIRALPNVDVAVIELDRQGQVVGAANVLLDRDKAEGHQVRIDPRTLEATGVEFSQWRTARWSTQSAWDAGPAPDDVLAGAGSDVEFMIPYPASALKVMVAYAVLRLVDQGTVALDTPVLNAAPSCGNANQTRTVEQWLDAMITVSGNGPTCALLQLLHREGELEEANRHFVEDLGLTTFRMVPGNIPNGSIWLDAPARMTMGAMDTARFMLLFAGSSRQLYRGPDGRPVREDVLSAESREVFQGLLAEQGFHEVLSTGLLCGSQDTVPGIPALVPERFISPTTGNGIVAGINFGFDVRPCNETAEVTFAHKTGLISVAGNDTGIVRALPGEDGRWYVVALHASVGSRFSDSAFATSWPDACGGAPFVCYPSAYARMGAAIDQLVKDRPRNVR